MLRAFRSASRPLYAILAAATRVFAEKGYSHRFDHRYRTERRTHPTADLYNIFNNSAPAGAWSDQLLRAHHRNTPSRPSSQREEFSRSGSRPGQRALAVPKGPGTCAIARSSTARGCPSDRRRQEPDRHGARRWPLVPTPRASVGTRAFVIKTTFTDETETYLFGEQAVFAVAPRNW